MLPLLFPLLVLAAALDEVTDVFVGVDVLVAVVALVVVFVGFQVLDLLFRATPLFLALR